MTGPGRVAACVVAVALVVPGVARAGDDEDSPWPKSPSTTRQLQATDSVVSELEDKVELMDLSVARYDAWQSCLTGVPVTEYGDPDRQSGYLYDERDGTGTSFMPALAVDRGRRDGEEDYLFLDFGRTRACRSDAPVPGGTADPAMARVSHAAVLRRTRASAARRQAGDIDALERRVARLKRKARRLLAASEHFDAWESCVSWVPVTEYGDPGGEFGYAFGRPGAHALRWRPALAVDRSDWDDPDYMFLAFVGGDRPGGRCQDEPGEGDD
jgi:hypothetical protein